MKPLKPTISSRTAFVRTAFISRATFVIRAFTSRTAFAITTFVILSVASQVTYAKTNMNRLFISPDLRAQIDKYRDNPELYKPKQLITRGKDEVKEIPKDKNIILKGLITKPDGSKVAWINDLESNQIVKQHKGLANDTVLIQISGKKSIPLKVGQIYQVQQNTVSEIFNQSKTESESAIKNESKPQEGIEKEHNKTENNEQSVEEPSKIIKTLIDIVNAKKAANEIMQNGRVEP